MRAIPPYAGPAHGSGVAGTQVRVGPFVPAAQRPAADEAPVAGGAMATERQVVQATAAPSMVVPASIPPYRPLRPISFNAPASRAPLYIPPVATPAGEPVVEDDGTIEPQLIPTAEFAIPTVFAGERSHATATNEPGDAAVGDASAEAKLPWIDAFLASTPAMPMVALAEPAQAEPILEVSGEPSAVVDQATTVSDDAVANVETMVSADEWPLEEAADEFRALRAAMDDRADREAIDIVDGVAIDGAVFAPLPEWRDDDLMDIMPVRHSGQTPFSNGAIPAESNTWGARARTAQGAAPLMQATLPAPSAQPEDAAAGSTAEEAAHALELLARRVRAGELTLPSYDPRMGEPAALLAALAALLGVKLR